MTCIFNMPQNRKFCSGFCPDANDSIRKLWILCIFHMAWRDGVGSMSWADLTAVLCRWGLPRYISDGDGLSPNYFQIL